MLIILGFGASLGLNKEEIYAFGGMMVSLVLISFSVTAFVYNRFGSVSVKAREIYSYVYTPLFSVPALFRVELKRMEAEPKSK